ncbi:Gfo/Idh/MocA family protein [Sphingobacterium olei]|nr:Gfo/Idh/MocA family oxidoreductase [Sphingobacterium olei]
MDGKRIGIIGLDSSHAIAFTKELNLSSTDRYKGYSVVAAFPYGSPTVATNGERITKYTSEIQQYGVKIVKSIEQLVADVDCVLLETNDGNLHLKQAEVVIRAGKALFIDKPISNSWQEAEKIFLLASAHQIPVFSSSALRFMPSVVEIDRKAVVGADIYSPAWVEPSHKDLYWYGIHGVEMLVAIMGTECLRVKAVCGVTEDLFIGEWSGGRLGTLRGIRRKISDFGGAVFYNDSVVTLGKFDGYRHLLQVVIEFFETGIPPFNQEETLTVCKFIDAAHWSRRNNGNWVNVTG